MHPIDPETLLASRAWLTSIARDLLGDAHRVEDAVHDTWVAALERPPASRDERRVRAWLASVVRNAARLRVRGDERRRAREATCARPEVQDSPSSTERLALQRDLASALLELEPVARELVVMRYFEGLPPREIARRTGLTCSAVRTRLSRALAVLRERLDEAYGGERRAWSGVLAASLSPTRFLRPAAGLTGILVMQSWTKVLLGAGVAIVLAMLALQTLVRPANVVDVGAREPAEDPSPIGLAADAAPEISGAPEPVRVALAGDPAPVPSVEEAATAVLVHARFVDASGRPLAGVEMRDPHAAGRERAESGADGRAVLRLAWPPEGRRGPPYSVQLHSAGPEVALRRHDVKLVGPDPVFLGDIYMKPGGSVRGRVVVAGAPAPGVHVWLSPPQHDMDPAAVAARRLRGADSQMPFASPTASTDAAGRYQLVGIPAARIEVWARRRGNLCDTTGPLDIEPGAIVDAPDLALEPIDPEWTVAGRLLGPGGEPVERARVDLKRTDRDPEGGFAFTSARTGEFQLLAAPGIDYTLEAGDESGVLARARLEGVRAGTHDLVVRLGAARWIEVRTTSPDGKPVMGVWAKRDSGRRQPTLQTEPVAPGRMRVRLPDEPFSLIIGASGHLPETRGPIDPRRAPDELALVLQPSGGFEGVVRSAGGPVAGAAVHAHLVVEGGAGSEATEGGLAAIELERSETESETGPDGAFFLPVYEDGTYVVHAEADGFARRELEPLAWRTGERRSVEVELERGGAIEGRLRVAPGLSPAGAVIVASRGNVHFERALTDGEGRFSFTGLASGTWELIRTYPGMVRGATSYRSVRRSARDAIQVEVQDGATAQIELDLGAVAPVEVRGRILLGGRAPSPGTFFLSASGAAWPATIGADGAFEVRVERAGEYECGMNWELGGRSWAMLIVPVELRAPSTELTIEIPAGRVTVAAPSGERIERDYALRWTSGDPPSRWEARLRSAPLTLEEVPAGTLELRRKDEWCKGPVESWTLVEELTLEADGECALELR